MRDFTRTYLVDTHILSWWLASPRKLSANQRRVFVKAQSRGEQLCYSATTLLELAVIHGVGNRKGPAIATRLLAELERDPTFTLVPITFDIAQEVATMGPYLQDPNDRVIVATARVHRMTLITADERIIKSKLVPVID